MLAKLFASEAKHTSWHRYTGVVAISVVIHGALLSGLAVTSDEAGWETNLELEEEQVTYVFLPEPEQPEPEPAPPEPEPVREFEPAVELPAPVEIVEPETPAGFQELVSPEELVGIPEPDPAQEEVDPEDFSGRGEPGGVAGGTPTQSVSGAEFGETYTTELVTEPPRLANRSELPSLLRRLYPRRYRQAGVSGKVIVEFVVGTDGHVELETVRVLASTHGEFEEATRQALEDFRFEPGRIGDRAVRVVLRLPVEWYVGR